MSTIIRNPWKKAIALILIFIVVVIVTLPTYAEDGVVESSPLTDPPPPDSSSQQGEEEGETRNLSRFPEDFESYIPMPLPAHSETESGLPESRFVSYDLLTGEETITEVEFTSDQLMMAVEGSEDGSVEEEPRSPLNFSALSFVADPENSPYRRSVKMFFRQSGIGYVCSGALIDPLHVITAGHCVHEGNGGSWSTNVVIVPAYENGARPFGDAAGIQLHSWTGWTNSGDWDDDIGIIDLNRPVGALTGWHGYGFHNDCGYFTGGTWRHNGYPAASPYSGQYMYTQSGDFDNCETILGSWYGNEVSYNRLSFGGQSGSGAYRDNVVRAVLSNGTSSTTWDVRITDAKFGHIRDTFIANDTPSTFDLIPLDVNSTPGSIVAGNQLSSMNFLVHNYSSASRNGTVNFTVYQSTNDNITTSDTSLGSASFTWNFGPKSSVRVNVSMPPTIPVAASSGNYYIGVILNISDANGGNNDSSGQDASRLTIQAVPVPPAPTNVQASDGTYTDKVRVTWNSVSGATYYEVYRAASVGGSKAKLGSPSGTAFNDLSAVIGSTYYYWLKACNTSGCSGYSAYNSGYRAGLPPASPPANVQASDGDYHDKVRVTWNAASGATSYEVYRAPSAAGTKTKIGTPSSTNFDDTGVVLGTTYHYWAKACNTWGCSGFSGSDDGFAGLAAPVLITPPDGSVVKEWQPLFEWNTSPGATEYRLQVDNDSDFSSPLIDVNMGGTSFTPSSRLADDTYSWRVKAGDGATTWSDYSDVWVVTVDVFKIYLPIILKS